ncbi:MAG TPA: hypothetical protein VKV27_10530 [Solirubrobacteraceae bacterium]|nr:hypothetical protein [Solirubrobacteraceae bacterium]
MPRQGSKRGRALRLNVVLALAAALWSVAAAGARGAALRWGPAFSLPGSYGILSLSCPAADLCVAGTAADLVVSTDPAGGARAWVPSASAPSRPGFGSAIQGVDCPTVALCVAVSPGAVLTSTRPAAGAGAWRTAALQIPAGWYLAGVGCEPSGECVAFARSLRGPRGRAAPRGGVLAVSADPTGGAGAWRIERLRDVADYAWCLARECALATEDGDILTAARPAAGPRAWRSVHQIGAPGDALFIPALACQSARACIAPLGGELRRGELIGSLAATRPFSWRYTQGLGGAPFADPSSASCVPGLCAVAASVGSAVLGGHGEVLTATRPGARWSATRFAADETPVVSCASDSLCVAAGTEEAGGCRPGAPCVLSVPTGVIMVGSAPAARPAR